MDNTFLFYPQCYDNNLSTFITFVPARWYVFVRNIEPSSPKKLNVSLAINFLCPGKNSVPFEANFILPREYLNKIPLIRGQIHDENGINSVTLDAQHLSNQFDTGYSIEMKLLVSMLCIRSIYNMIDCIKSLKGKLLIQKCLCN